MKQKSFNLGFSLTRNAIKNINGALTVDYKTQKGCSSSFFCKSGYAKVYSQGYICC